MHPYLTQALAAERTADFRRAAAASRAARLAATRTGARRPARHLALSRRTPVAGQSPAGTVCKSSVSRAA